MGEYISSIFRISKECKQVSYHSLETCYTYEESCKHNVI